MKLHTGAAAKPEWQLLHEKGGILDTTPQHSIDSLSPIPELSPGWRPTGWRRRAWRFRDAGTAEHHGGPLVRAAGLALDDHTYVIPPLGIVCGELRDILSTGRNMT
jgi:hypothetical protein